MVRQKPALAPSVTRTRGPQRRPIQTGGPARKRHKPITQTAIRAVRHRYKRPHRRPRLRLLRSRLPQPLGTNLRQRRMPFRNQRKRRKKSRQAHPLQRKKRAAKRLATPSRNPGRKRRPQPKPAVHRRTLHPQVTVRRPRHPRRAPTNPQAACCPGNRLRQPKTMGSTSTQRRRPKLARRRPSQVISPAAT